MNFFYSGTSIERRVKGLAIFVRYEEVSSYRGSFPYILPLLGYRKSFVLPRTSLYGGSFYRDSTVLLIDEKIAGLNFKPITAKSGLLQQPTRRKLIRFNTVKS